MLGQRTVAGLAIHAGMPACLLHLCNVAMARFTSLVARKVDGPGSNIAKGRAAVVAVFSEALRYNEVSNHEKNCERNDKQKGKPEKMP